MALALLSTPAAVRASRRGAAPARLVAPGCRAPRRAAQQRVCAGLVQKVNAEELEVVIAERDRPLVIDFFARRGAALPTAACSDAHRPRPRVVASG
jgi:hypothetical protein